MEGWGKEPAGWIYVAWHPERSGYTKIGYTLWHPRDPCEKYRHGIKRLHRIENYLEAFGFGGLQDWCSDYHPQANRSVRRAVSDLQRFDVGRNREIYDIAPQDLITKIKAELVA
jgi:hypothetical protein